MGIKYNILSASSTIANFSICDLFAQNLQTNFDSKIKNELFISEKYFEVLKEKIFKYEKELEKYAEIQNQYLF